ncbi:putative alpha-xylosidase [Xylogone sp. PMI_703]|nr:putative alpha-xylosidase [Xylogone sp. PMI_703]
MQRRYHFPVRPVCNPAAVVGGGSNNKYRFTLLTDGLIRYEWADDSKFEDRASVFAIHRDLPVPEFRVEDTGDSLKIITSRFYLTYDKKKFSPSGLFLVLKGFFGKVASVWRYGQDDGRNLGGTARTLDEVDGRTQLGPGVISSRGIATIDDSDSMLFDGKGFVSSRLPGNRVDGYIFAYGHDYRQAVKALYTISGSQPLLPRWTLGNWWSRYHPYSADEYITLMDKFREEGIPLSVAVVDMDWHLVDDKRVRESGSTGWTGYTWNKELFPDPNKFLADLHDRNLKSTLNDHPADGVYRFEDAYERMCKAMGQDPKLGDPVQFDITNRRFMDAFFDVLHHPIEDEGVDFWWVDWQQGTFSRVPGIDPLWMLNHYHFLDSARDNRRPLTFSRYAGPGCHRYPIGFSGDTVISWESLDFQPEFTSTASNIGYGWWSHDIGGHLRGTKDDELQVRWVQYAVFSPVLRLHSTVNAWMSKEPWNFGMLAQKVITNFMRLRHKLMPYIYTMNYRAAAHDEPLVQPIYWGYPNRDEAYAAKNEYFFGSELIVVPITMPENPRLRLAHVRGWLPPGRYVDIFSGAVYDGNREIWLSRPLDTYPVFAKEGAIIPMDAATIPLNGGLHPKSFQITLVAGADGEFEIMEDDGTGDDVHKIQWTRTPIKYTQKSGALEIGPTQIGSTRPEPREWSVLLVGMRETVKEIVSSVNGTSRKIASESVSNGILLHLGSIKPDEKIVIELGSDPELSLTDPSTFLKPIINEAQVGYKLKELIWAVVIDDVPKSVKVTRLHAIEMDHALLDALLEHILADSRVSN